MVSGTHAPAPIGPVVSINANLYQYVDHAKLRPGDIFKGQAVRFGTPEMPLSRNAFLKGVAELSTISPEDVKHYGLSEELVFSSIQDLQTYINDPQFPSNVDIVSYDFEGVMTPKTEYGDPVGSASEFAAIAHHYGKRVTFDPTAPPFLKLENSGQLNTILKNVDVAMFQGQKQLPSMGERTFISELQRFHEMVHADGRQIEIQLWVNDNGCQTMLQVFNESLSSIDIVAIGTHDDGAGAACVLAGLHR
jgi:hypothetical protein